MAQLQLGLKALKTYFSTFQDCPDIVKLSVIIPTVNEHHNLVVLIPDILAKASNKELVEIVVVDGMSDDGTSTMLKQKEVILVESEKRQRAFQMNLGTHYATGEVYCFLHADSSLPIGFDKLIVASLQHTDAGCFSMRFDRKNPYLSFYGYFTRFSHGIFHGGDASLFLKKECFESIGGYNETFAIMEDYDINQRLRKSFKFNVLKEQIVTSSRKYESVGMFKLQWHYLIIQLMYRTGSSQQRMTHYYSKYVR